MYDIMLIVLIMIVCFENRISSWVRIVNFPVSIGWVYTRISWIWAVVFFESTVAASDIR